MIINDFLAIVEKTPDQVAFILKKSSIIITKCYFDVHQDMQRMINFLKNEQITSPLLLFFKPSYDLYILIMACLYTNRAVVFIDDFKNRLAVKHMIKIAQVKCIAVNNKTKCHKSFYQPTRHLKKINISQYQKCSPTTNAYIPSTEPLLFTFSSGVSNKHKLIKRNLFDLEKQFYLIKQQIKPHFEQPILALLPMYVLANLMFGVTSLLFFNKLNRYNVKKLTLLMKNTNTAHISASVSKLLLFEEPLPSIKNCYTGGSLINYHDALKLKTTFPNAYFTYVYGASEALMMARTTLDEYLNSLQNNCICVGHIVDDITIKIEPQPIGEIMVSGNVVLNEHNVFHATGDIGYVRKHKLYLLGKKKACLLTNKPQYNYQVEISFLKVHPSFKKVCFYPYKNNNYLIIEGSKKHFSKLERAKYPYILLFTKKMPVDFRHDYKVDYNQIELLIKNQHSKLTK